MAKVEVSVVAPAYNEEACIEEFVNRIYASLSKQFLFEVIIIDDGSSDKTWEIIQAISKRFPSVRGIKLSRNFGHQLALLAGLQDSIGSKIVLIDADLQDPPELIVEMITLLKEDIEIVYGERIERAGEGILKKLTAKVFYKILNRITPFDIPVNTGDFRVVSRKALDTVLEMNEPLPYVRGLFAYTGFKSVGFKYDRKERFAGSTKYSFEKMIRLASSAIFGFSELPFRIFLRISWFLFAGSIMISIYALIHALLVGATNGWLSIFVAIMFFGSMQMLFLALIGNYIIVTNLATKNRPRWIIASRTNSI
jgi:glycosyltransferase involved in cell wall biosynthesis